jgi:formate/nitrite transporter FocA (FNT family)
MDYVLPNELVDGMIAAGGKKSTVSVKNLLIRGFYSGAILGLAVILALTVGITVKAPFVGSLLFPFGFASIVLFPLACLFFGTRGGYYNTDQYDGNGTAH